MDNTTVSINVGGEVFLTTTSTLMSLPNTLLADIVNPRMPLAAAFQDLERTFQIEAEESRLPNYNAANQNAGNDIRRQTRDRGSFIFIKEESTPESFNEIRRPKRSSFFEYGQQTPKRGGSPGQQNKWSPYAEIDLGLGQFRRTQDTPHNRRNNIGSSYGYDKTPKTKTIFIDRNPVLVPYILDAYRLGELHLPANVCSLSIRAELDFWKIPEDLISECCWKNFHEGLKTMKIVNAISHSLYSRYEEDRSEIRKLSWWGKIWLVMETPSYNWVAKVWFVIYNICILTSIIVFMLLTLQQFREVKPEFKDLVNNITSNATNTITILEANVFYGNIEALGVIEHFLRAFFTLEFLVRLLTCPAKLEFLRNVHNIMDVIIIALMWVRWTLDYIITKNAEHYDSHQSYILMIFNCLMGVRVLSVFHLIKYSIALKVMYLSIHTVLKELAMLVMFLAAAVLIFGTSMFLAENISTATGEEQVFENIPIAMWWAVVTMTTLGYGDFVPRHLAGYLVGALCAITGLLLFAMPIAIVAANFANYYDNITSRAQGVRRKLLMERLSLSSRWKQGPLGTTYGAHDKSAGVSGQPKLVGYANSLLSEPSEFEGEKGDRSQSAFLNPVFIPEPRIHPSDNFSFGHGPGPETTSTTNVHISRMYRKHVTQRSKWKETLRDSRVIRSKSTEKF